MLKCLMNYRKLQQREVCYLQVVQVCWMDSEEENTQQSILRGFCAESKTYGFTEFILTCNDFFMQGH